MAMDFSQSDGEGGPVAARGANFPLAVARIVIDLGSPVPLYEQIAHAIRSAIASGDLPASTPLPRARDLAALLDVGRNTVVAAYSRLVAEGYVVANTRRGTRVAERPPGMTRFDAEPRGAELRESLIEISHQARRALDVSLATSESSGPFALHAPDAALCPRTPLSRLIAEEIRQSPLAGDALADRHGTSSHFQAAIAALSRNARGVTCVPEQVIALSGVESALDLVARVMIDPGHAVYLDDPAADMVRSIFLAAGARLYPLPPEDRVAEFSSASCPPPRLIFVSPSVSFPFGRQMREVSRLAVLERAQAFGAAILEADTYGELVYTGGRLPALQAQDRDGHVLYFGSFNRTLGPGVRLSYLIVPPALAGAFAEMARRHAYGPDIFLQRALAKYVADGGYALHVRTIRGIYAERLGLLVEACRSHLGAARVLEPDGGLHLAILLDDEEDEHLVCRLAQRDALALAPLSHFYLSAAQRRHGLVLGFGSLPDRAIDAAVRCLARLIDEARALRLDGTFTLLAR